MKKLSKSRYLFRGFNLFVSTKWDLNIYEYDSKFENDVTGI